VELGGALSTTNPSLSFSGGDSRWSALFHQSFPLVLSTGGGLVMPLVVVLRIAQVPKRLVRLTPLGDCVGSLHGKEEVCVDDVLVDRIGG
jgi:hypothetical protein